MSKFIDNNKLIAVIKPYGTTCSWKTGYDDWVENFFIELLSEFCKKWPHANLLYRRRKGWIINDEKGFHYIALFFQLRQTCREAKDLKEKNVFLFTANTGITEHDWKGGDIFPTPKGSSLPPKYMSDGYIFKKGKE